MIARAGALFASSTDWVWPAWLAASFATAGASLWGDRPRFGASCQLRIPRRLGAERRYPALPGRSSLQ